LGAALSNVANLHLAVVELVTLRCFCAWNALSGGDIAKGSQGIVAVGVRVATLTGVIDAEGEGGVTMGIFATFDAGFLEGVADAGGAG
jgi:hypothetical protein